MFFCWLGVLYSTVNSKKRKEDLVHKDKEATAKNPRQQTTKGNRIQAKLLSNLLKLRASSCLRVPILNISVNRRNKGIQDKVIFENSMAGVPRNKYLMLAL